jgi:hypothetical protein
MEQIQAQTQLQKRFPFGAFIGGMVVVGGVWIATSGLFPQMNTQYATDSYTRSDFMGSIATPSSSKSLVAAPVGNNQERIVTNNYLSVHVKNVTGFQKELSVLVKELGGKVMSENVSVSSDDQSESGTFVVLVPNKDSEKFFKAMEEKSIKVVDKKVTSYQITQEYTDIGRQLAKYEETYEKIMTYYKKATSVNDLMNLQNQLDQVQNQIDSLKGRKRSLDELSMNTQYTIYSGTNEYNLPYVPQGTFEIAKTFKLAVRSLVAVADKALVLAVYAVVFAPLLAVAAGLGYLVKKYAIKKVS